MATSDDDPITAFFEALRSAPPNPLLRKAEGTIRFELASEDGSVDRWWVTLDRGRAAVAHGGRGPGRADATVYGTRELFGRIARGETNAMAAILRGALVVDGDLALLMMFQRAFSGPAAASAGPAASTDGRGRHV